MPIPPFSSRRHAVSSARRFALALALAWAWPAHAQRPEITIDPGGLPPPVLEAVTKAVDSIAALADDQDGGEGTRLRRRAREVTQTTLATEGYFSARVTLDAGTDIGGPTWDIAIEPGERAIVRDVDITLDGTVGTPAFAERAAALRQGWALKPGMPFRNDEWETSKRQLLDAASARDFPAARLVETAADIHAEVPEARLRVHLDSGPAVRLTGAVEVRGLKRVPEGVVERYLRLAEGEPYDRARLVERQQELQSTPYFRSAQLRLDRSALGEAQNADLVLPDGSLPPVENEQPYSGPPEVSVPVLADVLESRPRRMSVALGIDDEAGPRIETIYRQNVVFGQPVELESGLRVDKRRQLGYADIHLIPNADGYRDSFGVLAQHSDIEGLDVSRLAVGAIRAKTRRPVDPSVRVEYETRLGARLAHDRVKVQGVESYRTNTATTTYEWLRRDVNDKYDPREGNLIALGVGLGTELGGNNRFGRLTARGQYWWSLGKRDVLTARAEVGQLWARELLRVPDDFAFRTGGARSIRGYRYLGIGRQVGDAVMGDATLAVASIEAMRYFDERFGGALFVDVGDVAPSFRQMNLATGIGAGLRIRTPAGPLNLDLAYALRDKNVRLHFSLGIAF